MSKKIKLMVEIDEKRYAEIKRIANAQSELAEKTEAQIIANGTPITEGDNDKISLLPMVYNNLDEAFRGGYDKGYTTGLLKGKQTTTEGDLISREALKKELQENGWITDDPYGESGGLEEIIDKAPTVDAIVNTIEVRPKGDLISRQAVLELLNKWADGYQYIEIPIEDALRKIRELKEENT